MCCDLSWLVLRLLINIDYLLGGVDCRIVTIEITYKQVIADCTDCIS